MIERSNRIKIPLERVGVLIGHNGRVKGTIEERLEVRLDVDSRTGDIKVTSTGSDPSLLFRARDIVLAIGRGFSPEGAFNLFDEDLNLYVLDLEERCRSPSDIRRVKSRIIGMNGKTRRILEEETMTKISIYGHTISIIGDVQHLMVARNAVEMLIKGDLHRSVYRYLDRKRAELKDSEMELWKSIPDRRKREEA